VNIQFFSCLFAELKRDHTLILFVIFPLSGVVVGEVEIFGETGGFSNEESERSLLYVSIGGKLRVLSNVF